MKYMVCWLHYLREECLESDGSRNESFTRNIYMIDAKSKRDAVNLFLQRMALRRMELLDIDLKKECIMNMVRGIYRYGALACLNSGLIQKDFAYETKLVVNGNYYNPDTRQDLSEEDADILGIIKEIDTAPISEIIDSELFIDVFMETYRYEVAVVELKHLKTNSYY